MGPKKTLIQQYLDKLRLFVTSPKFDDDLAHLYRTLKNTEGYIGNSVKPIKHLTTMNEVIATAVSCSAIFGVQFIVTYEKEDKVGLTGRQLYKFPSDRGGFQAVANAIGEGYINPLLWEWRTDAWGSHSYVARLVNGDGIVIRERFPRD